MPGIAQFHPSESDYLDALQAHYRSRFRGARFRRLIALILLVAGIMALVVVLTDDDPFAAAITGIGGVLGGLGAIGVFLLIGRLMLPRWGRRLYRQQRTLHRDHRVDWTDEGVRWRTDYGDSFYGWHEFHRWRDTRDTILIYLNDQLFHFIPSRALDASAAADLRATLRAHGPEIAR